MVLVLDGKTDLNQISLTGARAIALLGLLIIAPRSLEEIRQAFIDLKIMDKSQSNDILRIDLNTLKSFGCEISSSTNKTGHKYVLIKQPIDISVTEEEIKTLKKLFDKIKSSMDISGIIEYDRLLNKISKYIYNPELKEKFLGISPFKHYDKEMLEELFASCINGYTVRLNYQKQYSTKTEEKEIVAQKLVFNNDKLYLYGYDTEKQYSVTLLFKRIKSVISKHISNHKSQNNAVNVKFLLKDLDTGILTEGETVKERSKKGYLIEGNYFNEFLAIQRILSFGSKCTVTEPAEFRNKIISKLKEMRKLYEKED